MLMRTLRSQVRWIMIAIVILFVLSIFGMYGFSGGGKRGSNENSSEDYTVAEIDGKTVRRSQLEVQLRQYVARMNARDITSADIPGLYQRTLENMAMVDFEAFYPASGGVRLVLQVHDSLVCECPAEDADGVERNLRRIMEGAASLSVPLKVESKKGVNLSEV